MISKKALLEFVSTLSELPSSNGKRNKLTVANVKLLLMVSEAPNSTTAELAVMADVPLTTAYRQLKNMSDATVNGRIGFGLIQHHKFDGAGADMNFWSLSDKGREVIPKTM